MKKEMKKLELPLGWMTVGNIRKMSVFMSKLSDKEINDVNGYKALYFVDGVRYSFYEAGYGVTRKLFLRTPESDIEITWADLLKKD